MHSEMKFDIMELNMYGVKNLKEILITLLYNNIKKRENS